MFEENNFNWKPVLLYKDENDFNILLKIYKKNKYWKRSYSSYLSNGKLFAYYWFLRFYLTGGWI